MTVVTSQLWLNEHESGAIRAIFTWGAELFNGPGLAPKLEPMRALEYQRITGAYHGSSTGSPHRGPTNQSSYRGSRGRQHRDNPAPGQSTWYDGSSPFCQRDSPIAEAFYETTLDPEEFPYGDREDGGVGGIVGRHLGECISVSPASPQGFPNSQGARVWSSREVSPCLVSQ
ncbi:hypothetical protein EV426DRAFT_308995 [Tirmania nivea]|nr:hypothetical protein EV426DRAFT_308995 [Tirmania nivea]